MSRRSGLGRGLAALIPPSPEDDATASSDDERSNRADGLVGQDPGDETWDAQVDGSAPAVQTTDDPGATAVPAGAPPASTDQVAAAASSPPPPPPDAAVPAATATLLEVSPERIRPNARQPREAFDPEELEGLAVSLADVGVLQPLVVRPDHDGTYELIAGERRWRAAKMAQLATIPVVVRHTDDTDLLKEALVENIHRVQLNPLEEAAAYEQLLEEFGVTQEELANRLGRSRPSISNTLRLLLLPPPVQRRVAAGVLSAGHAKALLALDDVDQQSKVADRIVNEGLSVRDTEELVRLRLLDDPAGGSSTPRRRTATAPGLIELQDDLSDALEARVKISMGARKGKLSIEFTSVDDLERIVGIVAAGLGRQGTAVEDTAAAAAAQVTDDEGG